MDKFRVRVVMLFFVITVFLIGLNVLIHRKNPDDMPASNIKSDQTHSNDTLDFPAELIVPEDLDNSHTKALDKLSREHNATSVAAAIIVDGKVKYHYEYGWADKESKKAMKMKSKMRIASLSKPVLTIAFMTMCDSGSLSLDSKIGEVFDISKNEQYKNISMRALLSHTAGINEVNALTDGEYKDTLSEQLKMDGVFSCKPFTLWAYSNLGFDIVGAAVEKQSGILFQDYTAEKIFEPMRIDASWDGSYISDSESIASSYKSDGKKSLDGKDLAKAREKYALGENFSYVAGGLVISAVDYARILTVLINDGKYGKTRILSERAVETMQTVQNIPTKKNFEQCLCLRYAENCYNGRSMYFHPGNAYGLLSIAAYDESDKSGVVIVTNGANPVRDKYDNFTVCSDMLNYIYQNIIDKE